MLNERNTGNNVLSFPNMLQYEDEQTTIEISNIKIKEEKMEKDNSVYEKIYLDFKEDMRESERRMAKSNSDSELRIQESVARIESMFDNQINRMDDRINRMDDRMSRMEDNFNASMSRMEDNFDAKITTIDQKLDSMGAKIDDSNRHMHNIAITTIIGLVSFIISIAAISVTLIFTIK